MLSNIRWIILDIESAILQSLLRQKSRVSWYGCASNVVYPNKKQGLDSKTWSALWFAKINFGPSPSTLAWSDMDLMHLFTRLQCATTSVIFRNLLLHHAECLKLLSRKQNCCRCHRIVTSTMVGTAERLRHWAAQQLTFCLTQEIILIHINTHRIHVWYNGIYANIGGILMVNVTILYSIHGSYGL